MVRERFRRGSFFNVAFLSIWGSVLNFSSSGHVAAGFSAVPSILAAFLTVVLPAAPPKPRRCNGVRKHAPSLWSVSSQHRICRQPHLFGSGVSVTVNHVSSARLVTMVEYARHPNQLS